MMHLLSDFILDLKCYLSNKSGLSLFKICASMTSKKLLGDCTNMTTESTKLP